MSDIEERPSKIRKLGNSISGQDPIESFSDLPNPTDRDDPGITSLAGKEASEAPALSRNQLKKIRRQEQWEAGKTDRRLKRREKHKEKQARKAERRKEIQEKVANGELDATAAIPKKDIRTGPPRPVPVPVSLIIDCGFDELMSEKEIISLGNQLTRCYSDNKSNPYRTHLTISSWSGTLKTRFETVLTNNHLGWKGTRFLEKDFVGAAEYMDEVLKGSDGGKLVGALAGAGERTAKLESPVLNPAAIRVSTSNSVEPVADPPESIGTREHEVGSESPASTSKYTAEVTPLNRRDPKEDSEHTGPNPVPSTKPSIIYLSSDSPNTLERLQPNTSYIIGGIVDKNRHKGICYKRACERGIATARLPIGEFMTMQSRSVLAVNHVVEIMLKWLVTGDWGEAFLAVIPKRKEAKLRSKDNGGNETREDDIEESEDEAADVALEP